MEEKKKEIKLKINDDVLKGHYANQIAIMHSKNDFIIDFITMFPPEAIVNARIITTPSSMKRMYNSIGVNIKKYEEQFGTIDIENEKDVEFPEKIN